MAVFYYKTEIEVLVGDQVELKVWLYFWRGWQQGRVFYVPGISPKNEALEFNGLSWVSIHYANGEQTGILVEPETKQLQKNVRFICRSKDNFTQTPDNYYFGDEEDIPSG
ncbi:MAG: hypothetical protein ABWZ66_01855 [Pyrinomonadaceae bacterium]